jgi:Flp pilus assembly protein TadG
MHKREEAQGLVEFALSLVVLVIILLGVFDLGRAFNAYMVVTNAAREGAYYGAMHPKDQNGNVNPLIVNHVIQEAQGSAITLTTANVTVFTSGVSGTPMGVSVYYDFSLFSFILPGVRTIRLHRSAEMVIY